MPKQHSRRNLFQMAGMAASVMLSARHASAQQGQQQPQIDLKKEQPNIAGEARNRPRMILPNQEPFPPLATRPAVSVVSGDQRRKLICDALVGIDDQLQPKLKAKKYVIIKPNNVGTNPGPAVTDVDAIRGILDYLAPRFKGPIVIGEASAGDTMTGFENLKYTGLPAEFKSQKISLVDFNQEGTEGKYVVQPLIDFNLHVVPVRLAQRLFDPDAFVISSGILKVHNIAIVTLSVKNMVLGAPLHQGPKETTRWSDKRRYHAGIRQSVYNMFLTAQKMQPFWGAAVLDGYDGVEGGFGVGATPVGHHVACASTDYIACDRVGAELMGVDPNWLGWLMYCGQAGVGQWDLNRMDIRGKKIADVAKKYRMHPDIELQLQWRGPMEELPPNLGWMRPITDHMPV